MTVTATDTSCGGQICGNTPLVSVTICAINNPSNCQTINNILLDTEAQASGSSSRSSIARSLLEWSRSRKAPTPWVNASPTAITQVTGDRFSMPMFRSQESRKSPFRFRSSTRASNNPPALCKSPNSTPDTSPSEAGFNGILGVQPISQDCGSDCTTDSANGLYYTCSGSDCSGGATVAMNAQVTNVVSAIPTDNNGVILTFPSISASGVSSQIGTMTIGLGTRGALPTNPTTLGATQPMAIRFLSQMRAAAITQIQIARTKASSIVARLIFISHKRWRAALGLIRIFIVPVRRRRLFLLRTRVFSIRRFIRA